MYAVWRLSAVHYLGDPFYDPVHAEHRRVSFSLFSYNLPQDTESCRAWRISWDPIFYELVGAADEHMRCDLAIYRQLDASKILHRRNKLPSLSLGHLAVDILGAAAS